MLIVPIFERQAAGVYRNSAAVIDADGSLLGVYRKMHIPDDPLFNEKYYFTPGDATQDERYTLKGAANGWRVWKTRYASIGVLICWDQWYPEAARITSLLGADILFYPTAIGWHPSEKAEFGADQVAAWRTIQRGALDRERRVRREPEPRRLRAGAGHERPRVLRPLVRQRSVRPDHRGGGRRSGGAGRDVRPARDRGYAAQLAVPARSADRCVWTDSQSISRMNGSGTGNRESGTATA